MPSKPVPYRPPEAVVADWIIRKMHRLNPIQEAELWKKVNWSDPHSKQIFNDHRDAALELLKEEGYILLEPGLGADARYGNKIRLTVKGRQIKDAGGYITNAEAKQIKDAFQAEVALHEGKKKRWDNQTKYFVFSFSVLSVILTIITLWEKCAPNKKVVDPVTAQQHVVAPDSTVKNGNTPPKKDPLTAKKHHPRTIAANTSSPSTALNPNGQPRQTGQTEPAGSPAQTVQHTERTEPVIPPPSNTVLRTARNDDIEFKLIKAEGNKSAQTITLTLLLTNSAANALIQTRVHSIFDTDGNEYLMKSHRHGAETFSSSIPLTTGVPIRCVYVFGGVLPSARTIRLFTFAYLQQSGQTHSVEFRDIFVDWN
jgi:hypothetical protein